MTGTQPPPARHSADVEALSGRTAVVRGRYVQCDVTMHAPDDDVAVLDGHVAIVLDDGVMVHLYPLSDPAARRPADEIARYEERTVEASGFLYAVMPSGGEASILAPCLDPVVGIRLVD